MKKFLVLFLACVAMGSAAERSAAKQFNAGEINVKVDANSIGISLTSSSPELTSLAMQAFKTHGMYKPMISGGSYAAKFTQVAANQVQVDITRSPGATPVHSQVVSGTSTRNALFKAADLVVEKTNKLGLKGYFASKLTFISERTGKKEVYVSDLFFGEMRQITKDNTHALSPRWSADGSKIVYTSFFRSGFPDIFQIDLNTYQRTTFASFKGTNTGARFSPAGGRVAMVLSNGSNPELYVGDAQGHGLKAITRTDGVESSACFSPDGSRVVVASDNNTSTPQLYVVPASGGSMQRLSTGSSYSAEPDWSRGNRDRIAFTARVGRGYQIGLFEFSKNSGRIVSKAPFDGIEPSWLADGRHLVYTARSAGESKIWVLDTETGNSVSITPSSMGQTFQACVFGP